MFAKSSIVEKKYMRIVCLFVCNRNWDFMLAKVLLANAKINNTHKFSLSGDYLQRFTMLGYFSGG